jgi:hypothetical protein
MTTKHTAGEWTVQANGTEIRSDNGTMICAMVPENGNRFTRTVEETEANAALIVQAVNEKETVDAVLRRCYAVIPQGELRNDIRKILPGL